MKTQYALEEQETTINVFPKNVSDRALVFTCIPNMVKRIKKLRDDYPDDVVLTEGDGFVDASIPRGWVKIQPKRKCTLTEEQKRANAERLAALREAKKEAKQT